MLVQRLTLLAELGSLVPEFESLLVVGLFLFRNFNILVNCFPLTILLVGFRSRRWFVAL